MKPQTKRKTTVEVIVYQKPRSRRRNRCIEYWTPCLRCQQRYPSYYFASDGTCYDCYVSAREVARVEFADWECAHRHPPLYRWLSLLTWIGVAVDRGLAWSHHDRLDEDARMAFNAGVERAVRDVLHRIGIAPDDGLLAPTAPAVHPLSEVLTHLDAMNAEAPPQDQPTEEIIDLELEIFRLTGIYGLDLPDEECWELYRMIDHCLTAYWRAAGIPFPEAENAETLPVPASPIEEPHDTMEKQMP